MLGHTETLTYEAWPTFDAKLAESLTVKMGVQVNGKARGEIELPKDADEALAKELALKDVKVAKFVLGEGYTNMEMAAVKAACPAACLICPTPSASSERVRAFRPPSIMLNHGCCIFWL